MLPKEMALALDLLKRAGVLDMESPTSVDMVLKYLARYGLELCYYDPNSSRRFTKAWGPRWTSFSTALPLVGISKT